MRAAGTILALLLAAGVACGGGDEPAGERKVPDTPADNTRADHRVDEKDKSDGRPTSGEVTGLVTDVATKGGEVIAFTIRAKGKSYQFLVDKEADYGFDLHHLEDHLREKLPTRVEYVTRSNGLYALAILDA
ncbi:MAG: hypothetical protein ACRDJI_05995 [Actinomycetota bacterium]